MDQPIVAQGQVPPSPPPPRSTLRLLRNEDILRGYNPKTGAAHLSNRNPNTLRLRLHAFFSSAGDAAARACVELHLRPRSQWIGADDLADVERGNTLLHISDASFSYPLPTFLHHGRSLVAAQEMLSHLPIDASDEMIESWERSVALFSFEAAKAAGRRKASRDVRMVVEISARAMSNPFEDKDMLDEEGGREGDEEGTEMVCPICYEELEEWSDEVVKLPCYHSFHWQCMTEWCKWKQQCPLCRHPLFCFD